MNPTKAIDELWKLGFFEEKRQTREIELKSSKRFKVNFTNVNAFLKTRPYLIYKKGWVQKYGSLEETATEEDFFTTMKIHPQIVAVSKKLFLDRHYKQAILEAFIKVNNLVKNKSGMKNEDGKSLMLKVFSPNKPTLKPILKLSDVSTDTGLDEQEGFMHIFAGSIQGIRNPKAHLNFIQKDKYRAMEYLVLASLLCKRLDETKKA